VPRGVHISVSLIAVLLLLQPFDCFSGKKFTQKAADCCKKGKCFPSSNADDCCKGTLPGGNNLTASKNSVHVAPAVDLTSPSTFDLLPPTLSVAILAEVHAPPGSPPITRVTLPLLI